MINVSYWNRVSEDSLLSLRTGGLSEIPCLFELENYEKMWYHLFTGVQGGSSGREEAFIAEINIWLFQSMNYSSAGLPR